MQRLFLEFTFVMQMMRFMNLATSFMLMTMIIIYNYYSVCIFHKFQQN